MNDPDRPDDPSPGSSVHTGRIVRREVRVAVSPDAAHHAWVDPDAIARWFVDHADRTATAGDVVTWRFDAMDLEVPVPVTRVTPGEGLVISGDGPDGRPFVQEVTIVRDGAETVVRVVNSGFREGAEWDEEYRGVDSGWEMALATLRHQLERYPEQDRHHELAMRPTDATMDDIWDAYGSPGGLQRWLGSPTTAADAPLRAGDELSLDLYGDGPDQLTGGVLASTGRELLLSWQETNGVLGLKAFTTPTGRMIALDYSTWADDPTTLAGWMRGRVGALGEAVE